MLMISYFDSEPNVEHAGHLGGFVAGILLGAAYAFEDSRLSENH
jgi:membrane associated rhomboid family serine protease